MQRFVVLRSLRASAASFAVVKNTSTSVLARRPMPSLLSSPLLRARMLSSQAAAAVTSSSSSATATPVTAAYKPPASVPSATVLPPRVHVIAADSLAAKLPFTLQRTKSQQIPVYTDIKNGGTRTITIVRKFRGDANALVECIKHHLGSGAEIEVHPGRVEVKGHHTAALKAYFTQLGF